ncbi:MAG: DEAD/DEAH box helicase [Candidatus Nitrosopumilus limneticus]|nr:putative ATP-dependent DNA helicase [Candidatus Nitrosopumilus limneticus]MDC4211841.1 DEAD/DEAH box helicase [Candidatus Nitrosopumilus limneticus]MDC4218315.1 DEAD/DEAH box helicase [Candidatus Nitrosopumilus limneticus]MDC4218839.1 DEAD/DEAH box helicase [Candidatus Nitrosopumilus limneticus]MDC4221901.1 DEAD/DEAH box helicase [Candidatus Nitrosopumilus limneticus]
MKIEKLTLPDSAIDFLKSQGYEKLYPPQADCVKSGLLDGKSILVSAPTASGKTLIAMLAMLSYLSKNEGKVIYLSPLRALAAEKFTEFKKLENILIGKKIKTSISTGDFNHIEKNLENSNVLILTNEKMDSIIRHGAKWIEDIGLVISDEVHLIGDESRGPTLEMILTHLKLLNTKPQIIGLSATITNSNEIADWLGCKLIKNDWRPVPLSEGVCDNGKVTMSDGKTFEVKPSLRGIPIDLGVQSVQNGGQSLVFAETRVRSKSLATKAADVISQLLKKNELSALEKISKQLLAENEHTEIVKTLAILIKKGVAFHHAGLNQKCREIVEKEFRAGNIKLLSSTPTLAAGVNLPARRVVISNINRYNAKVGANRPISILEYKQLCGRAGRPQYDTYGESIIVGNGNTEDLIEYYIHGEPEPIVSKITEDKSLRTHILSVIVTHPGIKKEELVEFFLQTLGGLQTTKDTLIFAINISLRFLLTQQLIIKKSDRYEGTAFGKKTSMLYIDPLTATYFRDAIDNVSEKRKHTFGFLHLMTNCEEFFPKFLLRNKDYEPTSLMIENHSSELIGPISEYDCSRSLLALQMWITESSELALSDTLGIEAGDMHRMVENANWLSYCLWEISKHIERTDLLEEFSDLRKRVVYGIRAELLDLVRVKGIGRIRARVLFKNNIKNLDDLAKIPVNKLADIDKIGLTIANNIKDELKKVRY